MIEQRPSPDSLLAHAQEAERQQKRGKLKIYLGAAPGVGKTYEMLHSALEERAKGLDVVVGIVDSHGRKDIEKMLEDLEILPQISVEYHGRHLSEFDLTGALKRSPGVILVDEMAHTNAPGLHHKKRWQDIKELLDRGIDVYTTLNVQHIESLSDDVAQIIHAPIRETVPDSMIEMADTIELVDLSPEELLKRLHEGKVYIPAQAEIAAESFFREGNLIALRELALRAVTKHVSARVLLYRRGQGIKQIWPTKEKILVCVGSGPEAHKLIREAKKMATNLQADWLAVYVEAPRIKAFEEKRDKAIQNLRFAEQLGASTRFLTGFDIVKEIMHFAREQNVTQIMVWKKIHSRWRGLFFRSLADEIVRNSGEIDVYIMTGTRQTEVTPKLTIKHTAPWKPYGIAVAIVGIVTAISFILHHFLSASNLAMIYILGVMAIALMGRIGPSIVGTILSVLAFDFFFIPPFYSFGITDIEYLLTFIVMLTMALVISHLTVVTRRQAKIAHFIEYQTSTLFSLTKQLSSTRGVDKLLNIGINYIADLFKSDVLALLPEDDHLVIRARCRTNQDLDAKEQGIAEWVYQLGQKAGLGTDSLAFSDALYIPLLGSHAVIGVLRIHPIDSESLLLPEKMQLLEGCANQIALALEVDRLDEQTKKSELHTEADRVKNALLRLVAHDLRTPLVAIIGAASTQIEMAKDLDEKAIKKMGKEIYLEAEQLSRLINNLLQINYLEEKTIKLQKAPISLNVIINSAIQSSSNKLIKRPMHVNIPDHLPLVSCDNLLLQEVLINLIDNAIKFTPPKSPIDIVVVAAEDEAMISIEDRGPGIVADEINHLFEKFYRGRMLTTERGLGLGLAICKIIVEAHGGMIWAENREEGGAAIRFTLPISQNLPRLLCLSP